MQSSESYRNKMDLEKDFDHEAVAHYVDSTAAAALDAARIAELVEGDEALITQELAAIDAVVPDASKKMGWLAYAEMKALGKILSPEAYGRIVTALEHAGCASLAELVQAYDNPTELKAIKNGNAVILRQAEVTAIVVFGKWLVKIADRKKARDKKRKTAERKIDLSVELRKVYGAGEGALSSFLRPDADCVNAVLKALEGGQSALPYFEVKSAPWSPTDRLWKVVVDAEENLWGEFQAEVDTGGENVLVAAAQVRARSRVKDLSVPFGQTVLSLHRLFITYAACGALPREREKVKFDVI